MVEKMDAQFFVRLPLPGTGCWVEQARAGLTQIFHQGYSYRKAGFLLLDMHPRQNLQQDLLGVDSINVSTKRVVTCNVMDATNNRFGHHTIWLAAQGHSNGQWQMRQQCRRLALPPVGMN